MKHIKKLESFIILLKNNCQNFLSYKNSLKKENDYNTKNNNK